MTLEQNLATQLQIKGNQIFAPLVHAKNKWLKLTPEEKVRQEYVLILHQHYGFAFDQMDQEASGSRSKRSTGRAKADLSVWRSAKDKDENKNPYIVVECKAKPVGIRKEDYWLGFNYASNIKAKFFVTTNPKETKFFKVGDDDRAEQFDEIVDIPNAQEILSEKKVQELLEKIKDSAHEEFSQLLFKCHNIIRNNDKLSPEAAFDEISKILFMKIRYEREQAISRRLFSVKRFEELKLGYAETKGPNDPPFYQKIFDQTKEFYAGDDLFDKSESLRIRENSFLHIVKELEEYNLSDTSDYVKGIAFEKFLGRTFRGELGQFFTPRTVVDYMVSVLDPEEGETVCDPCCGSGGFLIRAFEYVRDKIERHIQQVKEQVKLDLLPIGFDDLPIAEQNVLTARVAHAFAQLNNELDINNATSRLRELSYNCIFGTDTNSLMARTAKMNMIMHGDGHGGVHHHDGLLNVNGIFDGRFDIVLTNPPFGVRVEKSLRITENDMPSPEKVALYTQRYGPGYVQAAVEPLRRSLHKSVLSLYEVSEYSDLTEVLFLERCLQLLRPGGRLGIVLPEGVLNNSAFQRIREFVVGRAKLLNITSIPQDVFMASGATVKPSLIFLKKFTESESAAYAALLAEEEIKAFAHYDPQKQELAALYIKDIEGLPKAEWKARHKIHVEQLNKLDAQQAAAVRQAVKTRFNYPVPIVEVEKAGISSTGAVIDNELEPLAAEFTTYRCVQHLWENKSERARYYLRPDGQGLTRVLLGEDAPTYGSKLITVPTLQTA
jgi:type I restriction enzyme M protein